MLNQHPVRPSDVSDGLADKTLLFGERSHVDPNYQSFNDNGWGDPLAQQGWWGASTSRKMIGHVTMSAFVPINYRQPFSYANRAGQNPPADSFAEFSATYNDYRLCAYGSEHPGGAVFCFADGSTKSLASETSQEVLQALTPAPPATWRLDSEPTTQSTARRSVPDALQTVAGVAVPRPNDDGRDWSRPLLA